MSRNLKADNSGQSKIISNILTLLLLNTTCPVLANSVDPDHLISEDLHYLSLNILISNKNPDQVI